MIGPTDLDAIIFLSREPPVILFFCVSLINGILITESMDWPDFICFLTFLISTI